MKMRVGFVSNSSSSSFVVWGVQIPYDKITRREILWLVCGMHDAHDIDEKEVDDRFWDLIYYHKAGEIVVVDDDYHKQYTIGVSLVEAIGESGLLEVTLDYQDVMKKMVYVDSAVGTRGNGWKFVSGDRQV